MHVLSPTEGHLILDLECVLSLARATDMVGTAHSPEGDELAMVGAL